MICRFCQSELDCASIDEILYHSKSCQYMPHDSLLSTYFCLVCIHNTYSRHDMVKHMRKHTGEKPFQCPICMMSFTRNCGLVRHTLIHTGEKPLTCSICTYSCRDKSSLKKHILIKHYQQI